LHAQCSDWVISAIADSSTCAANGRIVTSLTGSSAGALSNILYSLTSEVSGGYSISPGTSSVFENVPAGSYRVIVTAVCGGSAVSAYKIITVPGNYIPFTVALKQQRAAMPNCNTGQATVTLANGRLPYTVTLTSTPAGYRGLKSFTTWNSFVIDSLLGGTYTFSVTDVCGAVSSEQSLTITSLGTIVSNDIDASFAALPNSCNTFIISSPSFLSTSTYYDYNGAATPLTYSFAYEGVGQTPFKKMNSNKDTITLPVGLTFKDIVGKTFYLYIKSPCGEVTVIAKTFSNAVVNWGYVENCSADFDLKYSVSIAYQRGVMCLPVYIAARNVSTGQYYYDTVRTAFRDQFTLHLPYGEYLLNAVTEDGSVLVNSNSTFNPPPVDGGYVFWVSHYNGTEGNDGIAFLTIAKSGANLAVGTKVELINPEVEFLFTVSTAVATTQVVTPDRTLKAFTVGEYTLRVTDSCGVYEIPVTIAERDVYRFNWSYTENKTCEGLKITPTGTSMYAGMSRPVYFKILSGPVGYDTRIVPNGTPLILPLTGTYEIGISASSTVVSDYTTNVKTINYISSPLIVDVNRSYGWVCPRSPNTAGNIKAYALDGNSPAGSNYTYRLAAAGNGSTGPYLATNTLGEFSTATSGGAYTLIANENYDIRVEDQCGAAAVQTIKIIDFATAQVVSTEFPEYCVGETVRFNVINLPTTAITYLWTGPNNFRDTVRNPVLPNIQAESGGTYHVVISTDICSSPIEGDVTVKLVPYVAVCYSAVTDTSVNPYVYGLLGNWRPVRSYTYYGAREQSDPNQDTDLRNDGAFDDFQAFWEVQNKKWALKKSENWVWNAESTIFNAGGLEIENKDPLGRYNSGIYGYGNTIAVAVVENSRYREAAYDGFEDYSFAANVCDTACTEDRRFDFSDYKSRIDSTQHHTGRYSIRVAPGDTIGIATNITSQEDVLTDPVFNKETVYCFNTSITTLKSIHADAGVILPSFSPLAGKKLLFSAWVKESQDCKCTSYENNQITLAVTGSDGNRVTISAKPAGAIIEGWQRYEQVINVPAGSKSIAVVLLATGTATVYYDDIRIHPYNANMKSFVYDARNLRMMAELDENNYATFFEYDDDATLTRVKKETERGVKTIKETRSALIKE
jgi:hypothetical protein